MYIIYHINNNVKYYQLTLKIPLFLILFPFIATITYMSVYIDNRKAYFNYEIQEKLEAGIELLGHEVKSIKNSHATLAGAYCAIRKGEVILVGMHITPYQPMNNIGHNPDRERRLLLSKKEIKHLSDADSTKGLTIIPLSLYSKGRRIKVELAIARGKKLHDKRETIKKRETNREIRREYKDR